MRHLIPTARGQPSKASHLRQSNALHVNIATCLAINRLFEVSARSD